MGVAKLVPGPAMSLCLAVEERSVYENKRHGKMV